LTEPCPVYAHEGLLRLFATAPVVALVEAHWVEDQHRLLRSLWHDTRFALSVDDVVVEFGNAAHQELVDRFLAGEQLPRPQPRRIWSECAGGLGSRVFLTDVAARMSLQLATLERRLAGWPVPSLAGIRGTWLADVDPTPFVGDTAHAVG
jgi:hypothetical protein